MRPAGDHGAGSLPRAAGLPESELSFSAADIVDVVRTATLVPGRPEIECGNVNVAAERVGRATRVDGAITGFMPVVPGTRRGASTNAHARLRRPAAAGARCSTPSGCHIPVRHARAAWHRYPEPSPGHRKDYTVQYLSHR